MTHDERMRLAEDYAQQLYGALQKILPQSPNESDFRCQVDNLLKNFCCAAGIDAPAHTEYTLARGRADAVFNRLILEYKQPGRLGDSLEHRETKIAVKQLQKYLADLAKKERHELARLAGVVFDGRYLVFVRYRDGNFTVEHPVPATKESLQRLFAWLASTASGIALTPENLTRDFGIEQLRTQAILRALYDGLTAALQPDANGNPTNPMVNNLFRQWQVFFSQSIDYSEAFGGRKLQPLQKWARKAGIDIKSAEEAERLFFVMHTYFALLAKLLGYLAVSRVLAPGLGAPPLGQWLSDSETLQRRLHDLESGGILRQLGIVNLLEGDFFAWYLYAWDDSIERALRNILQRLDEYDPTTLAVVPEETRDLFKQLYHYLLPREIRHNLGEYYTPDWLALHLLQRTAPELFETPTPECESQLRQRVLNTRFLDPACGSGTFLVLLIARLRELGRDLLLPESELLDAILQNVVGFDLNPLAVLTARVNYLLAIADLLPHREQNIVLPVYLADSIRTPAQGHDLYSHDAYTFPTAVGAFEIPAALCRIGVFDRFCDLLEACVNSDTLPDAFVQRVERELAPADWNAEDAARIKQTYERLRELHAQGLNGLWARLLKNNFAPLTVGQFDYIVGNPPWINWEHLPDSYRNATKDLWTRYQLAGTYKGGRPRLGAVKVDIATLMTYVVADALLKEGGKLGFVITQSVFKTAAGAGFRRFELPEQNKQKRPLKVLHVDDMVELQPFEAASNRTAVLVLQKGQPTHYPIDIKLSPPIPVSTEKPQDAPDASPHDKSPNTTQTTPTTPPNPNHNANTPPTPRTTAETHAPPYTNSYPIRPRATPTTASATAPHPSTSHTTRTTHATHSDCDTRLYENNSSTPETKSPPANAPAPTPPPPAPTTAPQAHLSPTPATASTQRAPASVACPSYAHTPATADAHGSRSPPTTETPPPAQAHAPAPPATPDIRQPSPPAPTIAASPTARPSR
jgi:SAM-dependent methyltransferase